MTGVRPLGKFHPSRLDVTVIASELREWLRERGIEPREEQIGVRTPADTIRACEATPELMKWHRDGAGPDPTDPAVTPSIKTLLVWSNGTPTHLCWWRTGYDAPQPFDVILFDNVNAWHRSPPPEEGRWWVGIADPKVSA
jgi:hypothetical protein